MRCPTSKAPALSCLALLCSFLISSNVFAQGPVPDDYCFTLGGNINVNVLDNDGFQGQQPTVVSQGNSCFRITPEGLVQWQPNAGPDCCGEHVLSYFVVVGGSPTPPVTVTITVKCPKPDCNLIDLSSFLSGSDNPVNPPPTCINVCENSEVTFFVPWNQNNMYDWDVVLGAPGILGSNPAEYIVNWGAQGTDFLTLTVTDASDNETNFVIPICILPAPVASFNSAAVACLDQCLKFYNTSSPAFTYTWDFGDNSTSNDFSPCHFYTSPGVYTVTLTATNQNFDQANNLLCCCTDVFSMEVEIDELPGPSIDCVSTICEGDTACYSTSATGCGSYVWTVLDANNVDITNTTAVTGLNSSQICVAWGLGPEGTVSLAVTGCDSLYCENPTTVVVPIIPSTSTILGPLVVCPNSTGTYILPKWMGTSYSWTVTNGALTTSGTGNIENIQWGGAGTGTIQVTYGSEFLACLPGHEEGDCMGTASVTVLILPSFDIVNTGPSELCVGAVSAFTATASPSTNYTWDVIPATAFGGQGTAAITVPWTSPGTYVVSATHPQNNSYCNAKRSLLVRVFDAPPPLGITGPVDICPGESAFYTVQPNGTGYSFAWTVTGGVLSSSTGATVEVTWSASGPYNLSVSQVLTSSPFCASPPFSLTLNAKGPNGPYTLTGGPACTNQLVTYTLNSAPAPHPDVVLTWALSDPTLGSIVGTSGNTVTVQWGNNGGPVSLIASSELCGNVVTTSLAQNIALAQPLSIVQSGLFCPGGSTVTLTATAGFTGYLWSDPLSSTTQAIAITQAGTYNVTAIDPANQCSASAFITVATQPSPVAQIYASGPTAICVGNTSGVVNLLAQTNANYQFTWFVTGPVIGGPNPVQGPSSVATFQHNHYGVAGTYVYYIIVTDITTGCTKQSQNFFVVEQECPGGGGPGPNCIPVVYSLNAFATPAAPYCDQFNFSFTSTGGPFTFSYWEFGDSQGSGLPSPSHTYGALGCYTARVCGTVPEAGDPTGSCLVCATVELCVPVVADFEWTNTVCGIFNFSDFSTFLPDPNNLNNITSWQWTAVDNVTLASQSSTATNPSFTFTPPNSVTVTLEVTSTNGCKSQKTVVVPTSSVIAPVITAPASVCLDDVFNFSVAAGNAVSYLWTFGSNTFSGQSGQFSYPSLTTLPGTYPISVTVTDALGCQFTTSVDIVVYPAVPPGVITAAPDLVICQGQTTTLTAPAGYTYQWTAPGNQTTQSITVDGGTYGVTLTDANGCMRTLDAVDVEELPLPQAAISGNLFICDAGCVTLSTPLDPGNTYQWLDENLMALGGQTFNQLPICDFNALPATVSVEVTDQNGCTNTAGPVTVQLAVSPSFSIVAAPVPSCAGQPNTLTITPIDPNVNYVWNTGATTTSITTNLAGQYTAVGTDITSGCSGTASIAVNPLPDLCIIPQGCYDICPPKEICAPPGLEYQWNFNGAPILGETDSCLVITATGTYTLTATNNFGCTTTTGDLVLNLIDCPATVCDSLSIDYNFLVDDATGGVDSCCVSLSYVNQLGGIKGIQISTNNGTLNLVPGSVNAALSIQSLLANSIALGSQTTPGGPIPQGVLSNFATVCLVNPTSSPQVIYISWIDSTNQVICVDSLVLNCIVEPPCIYVTDNEIFCDEESVMFSFTVCNPSSAAYPIGYIDILPLGPPGVVVTPDFINLGSNPILPGGCQTFVVQLTPGINGPPIEGETFCYNLVGHQQNPTEFPGTLCCSLDTLYCIDIPICNPCPYVMVEGYLPSESESETNDCCFDIFLLNGMPAGYWDGIGVNVLSAQTTLNFNNPFGSGWLTTAVTSSSLVFVPDPPDVVPTGLFSLPQMCLVTNVAPPQFIEIQWIKDGKVICRDTVEVVCKPGCGYVETEEIICEGDGWLYQATFQNTSEQTVNQAYIEFFNPAGLAMYNQTINFGNVPPNGSFGPFNFFIGAPAQAGDTVCFRVTLHEVTSAGVTLECCSFEHCIVLPDCGTDVPCACDQEFFANVLAGFTIAQVSPLTFQFTPLNAEYFGECDYFRWRWGHPAPGVITTSPQTVTHTFIGPGTYNVCLTVYRILPDSTQCEQRVCIKVTIPFVIDNPVDIITAYPNPSHGRFNVRLFDGIGYPLSVQVYDYTGRPVTSFRQMDEPEHNTLTLDLVDHASGFYMLRFVSGDSIYSCKVLIE